VNNMIRTFESLECDGQNNFEWDRYDAVPPDAQQDYLLLKRYDTWGRGEREERWRQREGDREGRRGRGREA
jgi:hypothetical protein